MVDRLHYRRNGTVFSNSARFSISLTFLIIGQSFESSTLQEFLDISKELIAYVSRYFFLASREFPIP